MNRKALAIGVILVWLAALAWLARRALWRSNAAVVAEAAQTLPPGAAYYTITVDGRQLGYASTTVDTLGDTLRLSEVVVFESRSPVDTHRTDIRTEIMLTRALRMRGFTATARGDEGRFTVEGTIEAESTLTLRIAGAGAATTSRIGLARPLWLSPVLALSLAAGGGLVPGRVHSARLLDPATLDLEAATVAVTAESTLIVVDSAVFDPAAGRFAPAAYDTVRAWGLHVSGSGPTRTVWVDDDGLPVLETAPGGFRVERSAFEIAYENFRRLGEQATGGTTPGLDRIVRRTLLAAGVPPPARPADRMIVRLGGRPLDQLALTGDRQRLAGDTLYVEREGPAVLTSDYRLPTGRRDLAPYVRGTPTIQRADPRIEAQARQIIGRTRTPERAAALLVAWVHQNVGRDERSGGPSALDVLETRQGDCGEHAVLFTALARAVGLPARIVTGLVHRNGLFYYHAWPEVYLAGWVAVDPTFGQFPADAARVRLAIGGRARQLELARLIAGLIIDVVSADQGG